MFSWWLYYHYDCSSNAVSEDQTSILWHSIKYILLHSKQITEVRIRICVVLKVQFFHWLLTTTFTWRTVKRFMFNAAVSQLQLPKRLFLPGRTGNIWIHIVQSLICTLLIFEILVGMQKCWRHLMSEVIYWLVNTMLFMFSEVMIHLGSGVLFLGNKLLQFWQPVNLLKCALKSMWMGPFHVQCVIEWCFHSCYNAD